MKAACVPYNRATTMSRCLTAALCVLLSVSCALGSAGNLEAQALSIFSDSTAWDILDGADWQAQVEQRARLLLASESSGSSAEPSSCLWCRKELKVWLQRSNGGLAAAAFPRQHRCVRTPLQCQLKTLSAVTAFLSAQHCGEGRRLWQRLRPTFASGFRRIVQRLTQGRSFAALRESAALADKLGWAWHGTHLTAWGHGHTQCWDQVALLRVMMNDKAGLCAICVAPRHHPELPPLLLCSCCFGSERCRCQHRSVRSAHLHQARLRGCLPGFYAIAKAVHLQYLLQ
jgi:hypothetical protein